MIPKTVIEDLENEWNQTNGFLGNLRRGIFDSTRAERLIKTLEDVKIEAGEMLDQRFVSLVWFIPLFVTWQQDRVLENGGDIKQFTAVADQLTTLVERILGVP
jgi:hypothetical protein